MQMGKRDHKEGRHRHQRISGRVEDGAIGKGKKMGVTQYRPEREIDPAGTNAPDGGPSTQYLLPRVSSKSSASKHPSAMPSIRKGVR